MGNTVYAEGMGLFHKGSGGKGIAFPDVCKTPAPPAPFVPVPYPNMLQATNLTKGSKKVLIQGNPTALENTSEVATSTGNEAGTAGGGMVTSKIKGKGSFKLWSFTVTAEGKGVALHGHMMFQNTMSDPPNCVDAAAMVNMLMALVPPDKADERCEEEYDSKKHRPSIKMDQRREVEGKQCWECAAMGSIRNLYAAGGPDAMVSTNKSLPIEMRKNKNYRTVDHTPPLAEAWEMGGCHLGEEEFKKEMSKPKYARPHCLAHRKIQGADVKKNAANIRAAKTPAPPKLSRPTVLRRRGGITTPIN